MYELYRNMIRWLEKKSLVFGWAPWSSRVVRCSSREETDTWGVISTPLRILRGWPGVSLGAFHAPSGIRDKCWRCLCLFIRTVVNPIINIVNLPQSHHVYGSIIHSTIIPRAVLNFLVPASRTAFDGCSSVPRPRFWSQEVDCESQWAGLVLILQSLHGRGLSGSQVCTRHGVTSNGTCP